MNIYKLLALIFVVCLGGSFYNNDSIRYCSKEYIQKTHKVYLKDEDIEATMMQITNKKTKKFVFGYFVNGIRNDTNFIYSKLQAAGDTITCITYHRYAITKGIDSTINKYICTKDGLLFHKYQAYWNGKIKSTEYFNKIIDKN
jgi:hypothetical protein